MIENEKYRVAEYRVALEKIYEPGQGAISASSTYRLPDNCSKEEFLSICAKMFDDWQKVLAWQKVSV